MSFLISANRLFILTQVAPPSQTFRREILSSSPHLSNHTSISLRPIFGDHTSGFGCRPGRIRPSFLRIGMRDRGLFIDYLLERLEAPTVERLKTDSPRRASHDHGDGQGAKSRDVEPFIGVSKLSCIMCSHYIHAFNEVTKQKIATKGSHGKAYPGWFLA